MNHYSFRYIYHSVYMVFSINWSWSLHADEKKGGDSFSHTNRGGTLECRWRCHIHLHHSGKLWVFNLGLDWIVQGERETERKKKVDWWTKTQKETQMRSESQSGSLTSGDFISLCSDWLQKSLWLLHLRLGQRWWSGCQRRSRDGMAD